VDDCACIAAGQAATIGNPNERSAATQLLRERVTRRDVGRFARALRRLFRTTAARFTPQWMQATNGNRSCGICLRCFR
jgi:hypothetical protein